MPSSTFDPDFYWKANGPYLATASESAEHVQQEAVIRELLAPLKGIRTVIDVGCGGGRLAAVVRDILPAASYTGLDLGEAQLASTRKIRPDGEFILGRLQDFRTRRKWDLVLCSEVMLHIPPVDIAAAAANLRALSRKWLLTVDWTQPVSGPIAEWNWLHDYDALYSGVKRAERVGLQTVFLLHA